MSSGERIIDTVSGWDRVSTGPGRFGSTRLLVGRRELGHVHGDSVVDLPLPKPEKERLLAEGRVDQHRFTPPKSGWVTVFLHEDADVRTAIELLREQYDRATRGASG